MTTNAKNSSSFGISSKFSFFCVLCGKTRKIEEGKRCCGKQRGEDVYTGEEGGGSDRIKLNHGSMILNVSNT